MLVILIILAVSSYLLLSFYSKVKKLPPGPTPLPLIGNLHQLAWHMIKERGTVVVLRKWQQQYGDVYTWWLGPMATVNICDYNTAVDSMIKKGTNFTDRPYLFIFHIVRNGRGVIMSNGEFWNEQRRFALHTLRNMGLGRNLMQDRIMLEYDYRASNLDKLIDENGGTYNFDPYHFIELTIGNIINRMLFSERFTEDKEKHFFELKEAVDYTIESTNVLDFALNEWTAKLPYFKQRLAKQLRPIEDIVDFVTDQIEQRKSDIASGKHELRDEGDDFVDAFLLEMKKSDHGDSFDEFSLKMTVLDLWFAGQETTTTSLYWALNYLIQHHEVVRKVQAELDSITGRNRALELADKPKTHYLNATISETLRLSSIVPLNIWRVSSEDCTVGDFSIPKGTAISAQLSLLMSDKRYFQDADKFNPDRFLGSESEQHVTAFGLGKRACLGESLARAELYLFLGNLLLSYNIGLDEAHPPSMKALTEKGSVRKAHKYHLNISKRR